MNPVRTCVACRKSNDKADLLRFVKGTEGQLVLDASKKMDGRGAYICKDEKCFNKALKGIIFRKLNVKQSEDDIERLKAEFEAIKSF